MEMEPKPVQPTRKRSQFSLSTILFLFLAVQLFIGITAFLHHVGFFLSCFAVTVAIGWWWKKRRLTLAATTGLLVYIITYAACWVGMGYQSQMHRRMSPQIDLRIIGEMLAVYADENRAYPESLADLPDREDYYFNRDDQGNLLDPWGRPYYYKRTKRGFELVALGRDGVPGGEGLDADIQFRDVEAGIEARLPWRQFLFETPGSGGVLFVAIFAGLWSSLIWYGTLRVEPIGVRLLVPGIVATIVSATIVAYFLAAFHIAVSQSGH